MLIILKKINTFRSLSTGEKHQLFVYKQHTSQLNISNPAKFQDPVTWGKKKKIPLK